MFGSLEVRYGDVPVKGLHLREGARLLAFLTIKSGTEISYRQLAQRFWPFEARLNDQLDGGDFPCTRQAIYALRRTLGLEDWRIERVGKGLIRFNLDDADVDYLTFMNAVASDDPEQWRTASALYRAPLLPELGDDWVIEARNRCQRSYARITQALPCLPAPSEPPSLPVTTSSALSPPSAESHADISSVSPPQESQLLESDGGAVPLNSRYYVERLTDQLFIQAVVRHDSVVLVKGARQVGKTSLLARGLSQARQMGKAVVLTDFQKFNEAQFASIDAFYMALASSLAMQLELEVMPRQVWDTDFGSNMNLELFLRQHVLRAVPSPLVWGMDEVDRLFHCSFGSEVFGLFRSWHNERALNPSTPWSSLSLAIAYATEAHLFISDLNQSPFNVGTRLTLEDFTLANLADLNERFGKPLDTRGIERLHQLVGGQPYLVRRAFSGLVHEKQTIDRLEAEAHQEEGLFGDHLRRLLVSLNRSPDLHDVIYRMLDGQPCSTPDLFYRLRTAGILIGTSTQDARFRCQLYSTFLRLYKPPV